MHVNDLASAAFRALGRGTALCSGRDFATNEVLTLTAMFALRYDNGAPNGTCILSSMNNTNMTLSIMAPDTDVEVEVPVRKGFDEGRFACSLQEADVILAVCAFTFSFMVTMIYDLQECKITTQKGQKPNQYQLTPSRPRVPRSRNPSLKRYLKTQKRRKKA